VNAGHLALEARSSRMYGAEPPIRIRPVAPHVLRAMASDEWKDHMSAPESRWAEVAHDAQRACPTRPQEPGEYPG
jgi:hypothetical protein